MMALGHAFVFQLTADEISATVIIEIWELQTIKRATIQKVRLLRQLVKSSWCYNLYLREGAFLIISISRQLHML